MTRDRRLLTYVTIALIVGAALALAVALAQSGAALHGATAAGGEPAAGGVYSDSGDAALAPADPAKEEPLLDKFTSKDPFIQFGTSGTNPTPTPTPTSTPKPSNLSARVKVDGTTYNVMAGDKVPGGSAAAFTVKQVTSGDVTFGVIDGKLKNGATSFSVNLGESVRVTLDSGKSYDISVVAIGSSGGGGSGGTGHSIAVLSVSVQNGTALATFEVDGKVYSDKAVGARFTTSWGQIEVLAIDVDGQTVTILHGDQTIVLYVGQVVVK